MTSEQVRILGLGDSVYTRIALLALEEKGIAYALREVDIFVDSGLPRIILRVIPSA